jgi:hypothetical protein
MKKKSQNIKTLSLSFFFILLIFVGTLGVAPVSAKADKQVFEEQFFNIDDPMKTDESTPDPFNLVIRIKQLSSLEWRDSSKQVKSHQG